MKLDRLYVRGADHEKSREFRFSHGINLLELSDETDRRIFFQGLSALLYGVKNPLQKKGIYSQTGFVGGELDFTLENRSYRLVQSHHSNGEQPKLLDLESEKDLTDEFLLDGKEPCLLKKLTGYSPNHLITMSHVHSNPRLNNDEIVEKIRQLANRGEETNLDSVLKHLGNRMQRTSDFDSSLRSQYEKQKEEVSHLRERYQRLREDYVRLNQMKNDMDSLQRQRCRLTHRIERLQERLRKAEKVAFLQKKVDDVKNKLGKWKEIEEQIARLERRKVEAMPPHRLTREEIDELREMMDKKNEPKEQVDAMKERLDSLSKKIEKWEEDQSAFLGVDESLLDTYCSRLEEYRRLEERLMPLASYNTMEDRVRGMQIEKDYHRLHELRQQDKKWREIREDLDRRVKKYRHQLEVLEREDFLTRMVAEESPPARSSSRWLWITWISFILSLFVIIPLPFLGLPGLVFAGISFYRYRHLSQVDAQVHQEWHERYQRLENDLAHIRQERRHIENHEGSLPDLHTLRDHLSETERERKEIKESMAAGMHEREVLLNRWNVKSGEDLAKAMDRYRQKLREREEARKADRENREHLKRIREEVESWAKDFCERLGPFHPETWLKELQRIRDEARNVQEKLQRMKLEAASLEKELARVIPEMENRKQRLIYWKERLGTDHLSQWSEWILANEEVQRLDDQLRILRLQSENEWEKEKRNRWESVLKKLQYRLDQKASEERESPERISTMLTSAKEELDGLDSKHQETKTAFMRLKEQLRTLRENFSSLAVQETLLFQIREEKKCLELEHRALETAKAVWSETANELREELSPQLAPYIIRWVEQVTNGRYTHFLVDPAKGIEVSVFVQDMGKRQPIERLSRGTLDQFYLAIKLALNNFYTTQGKDPLPVILHNSFVHFDDHQLRESFHILNNFALDHQLILCTDQTRERPILEEEEIDFTYYN